MNTLYVNNPKYIKSIDALSIGPYAANQFTMKRIFTLLLATGLVATTYAQDAAQPKGSWYLGTGDATTVLNIFSTGWTSLRPWVTLSLMTSS